MSSYSYFDELPRLEDIEPLAHTNVLVADARVDQGRIRAAVDAVFTANPALGAVFEPCFLWTAGRLARAAGGAGGSNPRESPSRT